MHLKGRTRQMRDADPKSNRSPGALSDVFIDTAVDAINQTGETVKNPLFSLPLKRDAVQARLVRHKSRHCGINHPVTFPPYMPLNRLALHHRRYNVKPITRESPFAPRPRIRLEAENPSSEHRLPLRNRPFPDLPSFFYSPPRPGDQTGLGPNRAEGSNRAATAIRAQTVS